MIVIFFYIRLNTKMKDNITNLLFAGLCTKYDIATKVHVVTLSQSIKVSFRSNVVLLSSVHLTS